MPKELGRVGAGADSERAERMGVKGHGRVVLLAKAGCQGRKGV